MATALTPTEIAEMQQLSDANPKLEGLVVGAGALKPKFILVAEAPGKKEIELGRGFVGPSGQELQRWLDELQITREEIYMTATVRARPIREKNGFKRDRSPTKAELKAFAPFLDAELSRLDSDTLVVLGNSALHRLLGDTYKISQVHGEFLRQPIFEYVPATNKFQLGTKIWTIIPLFHPSYVRRFSQINRPIVAADLVKLKAYLQQH